jgi:hypothetical protein
MRQMPLDEQEQIEFIHDIILEHFKGSNKLAREWFESENTSLHGETPIKSIRSGNVEKVFKLVKKLVEDK